MVEYLSGNRIQGSSTPDINTSDTPTQDFDFSSQGSWDLNIEGSSSHWDLDNSRLNFETKGASSGSGAHFDLTSVPDKWILRFKVRIDSSQTGYVSAGQGDGLILIGLQSHDTESSNTASAPNTSNQQTYSEAHQQAQFIILFKSNATEGSGRYSFQGKFVSDSNAKQCSSSTSPSCNPVFNNDNIYDDTDYYVEIKKTGTTCQISYGTNSDYTTGRTVGTATGVSGLDGLRYIHVEGVAQNVTYDSYGGGYIDDMKYWATVDEKTTLTNIPANTRYEETDTRKIYRFKESDTLEQLNGSGNKTVFTHSGNEAHYGIKINTGSDLIGKVISKVHFKIKQNENPTTENLVYVRLWRGSSFAHTLEQLIQIISLLELIHGIVLEQVVTFQQVVMVMLHYKLVTELFYLGIEMEHIIIHIYICNILPPVNMKELVILRQQQ